MLQLPNYSIFSDPKPGPGPRGCRDRELVYYVGRFGIVSIENVMVELDCERTAAYRRVKRCIDEGLLERLDLATEEPSVLRATRDGLRYAGLGLQVAKVSPGAVRHWLWCARVAQGISAHQREQGHDFRIITERELPLAEKIEDHLISRARLDRPRSEEGPRLHNPDLTLFLGDKHYAIEVELTPKSPARLIQIMLAWATVGKRIDVLVYYCARGQTMRAVKRAAERTGVHNWTIFEEIEL